MIYRMLIPVFTVKRYLNPLFIIGSVHASNALLANLYSSFPIHLISFSFNLNSSIFFIVPLPGSTSKYILRGRLTDLEGRVKFYDRQ